MRFRLCPVSLVVSALSGVLAAASFPACCPIRTPYSARAAWDTKSVNVSRNNLADPSGQPHDKAV